MWFRPLHRRAVYQLMTNPIASKTSSPTWEVVAAASLGRSPWQTSSIPRGFTCRATMSLLPLFLRGHEDQYILTYSLHVFVEV